MHPATTEALLKRGCVLHLNHQDFPQAGAFLLEHVLELFTLDPCAGEAVQDEAALAVWFGDATLRASICR